MASDEGGIRFLFKVAILFVLLLQRKISKTTSTSAGRKVRQKNCKIAPSCDRHFYAFNYILCILLFAMYSLHCILCIVINTLYSKHSILFSQHKLNQQLSSTEFVVRLHFYREIHLTPPPHKLSLPTTNDSPNVPHSQHHHCQQ